jgi:trigger factor
MIRGTILPELTDEFAKTVGPFSNVDALQDAIKANLDAQSKADYDDEYFNKLIDLLKKGATIKYPPQTLEHEIEHVMEDIKSRLAGQSMDLTAYLKTREMDEAKFIAEEARPVAVKRLERSLIMEEIARRENIELDKELLNKSFQQTWGEIQSDQSFQKSMRGRSQPSKQLMNAVARESAGRAYIQQTLERMKAIATGELAKAEKKASKDASSDAATTKKARTKKVRVEEKMDESSTSNESKQSPEDNVDAK